VESIFRNEAKGNFLREILLWLKILLVEEGILPVPLGDMVSLKPTLGEG
jgi:hypothetical protein